MRHTIVLQAEVSARERHDSSTSRSGREATGEISAAKVQVCDSLAKHRQSTIVWKAQVLIPLPTSSMRHKREVAM